MPETFGKVPYVKQSISLRQDQLDALRRIVTEEERHGKLSRYFQELVDADIERRADRKVAEKEPVAA